MGETGEDPLQGVRYDMLISTMNRGMETDLLEMLETTDVPKPLLAINDIEMDC